MNLKNKGFTVIEVLVLLALLVVVGVFLFNLTGCTDDDQAKEVARQKRIEAQEQQEQQARDDHNSQEQTSRDNETAAQAKEEEKPAEPKKETVTTYHFTSTTERNSVDCASEGKVEACGVVYDSCGREGNDSYACQTGVHEWSTSREELVKDN